MKHPQYSLPLLPDEVGIGTGGFVVAGGGVEPKKKIPHTGNDVSS